MCQLGGGEGGEEVGIVARGVVAVWFFFRDIGLNNWIFYRVSTTRVIT